MKKEDLAAKAKKTITKRRDELVSQHSVDDIGGGRMLGGSEAKNIPCRLVVRREGHQKRIRTDLARAKRIAESISTGIMTTPIVVRPIIIQTDDGPEERFELIDGEHRFIAVSEVLQWDEIPSLVRRLSDEEAEMAAFVANAHREGYFDYEIGKSTKDLMERGLIRSIRQAEELTGFSKSRLHRAIKLASLPQPLLDLLNERPDAVGGTAATSLEAIALESLSDAKTVLELVIEGKVQQNQIDAWWRSKRAVRVVPAFKKDFSRPGIRARVTRYADGKIKITVAPRITQDLDATITEDRITDLAKKIEAWLEAE